MISSIDGKKAFVKIQHRFMIKTLHKMGIEGTYLNIINAIEYRSKANIILNSEKLKAFSLRSGTKQGCPHSPLLFSVLLEVLATTTGQEKEILTGKKDKTVTVCRWHDTMYRRSKRHHPKLLELINEFSKVSGYKIINLLHFYTLIMNYQKEKSRKQFYLQKNKVPRNSQRGKDLHFENHKTLMEEI